MSLGQSVVWLVGICGLCLLLLVPGRAGAVCSSSCGPSFTATYTGGVTMTLSGYQQNADGSYALSNLQRTASVSWSMSYDSRNRLGWVLSTLSGSMQESAIYPVTG